MHVVLQPGGVRGAGREPDAARRAASTNNSGKRRQLPPFIWAARIEPGAVEPHRDCACARLHATRRRVYVSVVQFPPGVCAGCAETCHDGHVLHEVGVRRRFVCDCGTKRTLLPCDSARQAAECASGAVVDRKVEERQRLLRLLLHADSGDVVFLADVDEEDGDGGDAAADDGDDADGGDGGGGCEAGAAGGGSGCTGRCADACATAAATVASEAGLTETVAAGAAPTCGCGASTVDDRPEPASKRARTARGSGQRRPKRRRKRWVTAARRPAAVSNKYSFNFLGKFCICRRVRGRGFRARCGREWREGLCKEQRGVGAAVGRWWSWRHAAARVTGLNKRADPGRLRAWP